jgi:glucosamine kinase
MYPSTTNAIQGCLGSAVTQTRLPTSKFYLGVDGGGTQCRVRLENAEGKCIAQSVGGPANVRLGQALVWGNILTAIDGALAAAGLGRDALKATAAGFGLAGILKPQDHDYLTSQAGLFNVLAISSDCHTACLGAFDGRDGGIQIVGTGSSGYAIVGGIGYPRGGWGFYLAEKASGAALGRDAIRAALEAHDGLADGSALTQAVMARFGAPVAVVDWSDTALPRDYAVFAPLVFQHAEAGDVIAVSLLRALAADCARYMDALTRLGAPRLCLLGGMAPQLKPWLPPALAAGLAEPVADALGGALWLARGATAREGVQ